MEFKPYYFEGEATVSLLYLSFRAADEGCTLQSVTYSRRPHGLYDKITGLYYPVEKMQSGEEPPILDGGVNLNAYHFCTFEDLEAAITFVIEKHPEMERLTDNLRRVYYDNVGQ